MTVDLFTVCLLFTPTLWSHYTNFQESSFNKSKREVLIFLKDLEGQLHQTRCLHCSRCINVSVKRRFFVLKLQRAHSLSGLCICTATFEYMSSRVFTEQNCELEKFNQKNRF